MARNRDLDKMRNLSLFVFIDALGWQIVKDRPVYQPGRCSHNRDIRCDNERLRHLAEWLYVRVRP